ncbi:hypothetical protein Zmor_016181 [Zophobas morio]|uniref:Odorant receptor n=1 Tax=Zophobas morio TaxID=2755281 RepID=A0AA38ING6_9CUCU|nr:hypothetical protein Zmor_016181 [Zophobas morio]
MVVQHQSEMKDDPLTSAYLIGYKIFQKRLVKSILKCFLCIIPLILLLQICIFVSTPNFFQFAKYGLLFAQTYHAAFAAFVHLYENNWIDDLMSPFPFWDIHAADEKIKTKIKKETKIIKTYVVLTALGSLLWGSLVVYSSFARNSVSYIPDYIFSVVRLTAHVIIFLIIAHPYQIVYITQVMKFQMYLFNNYIEEVCCMYEEGKDEENLVNDRKYQEEINLKLKLLVRRHCDFKRWRTRCLEIIHTFIIPFSVDAGVHLFLVMYFIVTREQSPTIVICYNVIYIFLLLSVFVGVIVGGETLQDESDNTFTTLVMTKWYNFNCANRRTFLLILCNNMQPIKLDFSRDIAINYRLGVAICKAVYSTVSVFH